MPPVTVWHIVDSKALQKRTHDNKKLTRTWTLIQFVYGRLKKPNPQCRVLLLKEVRLPQMTIPWHQLQFGMSLIPERYKKERI